MLQLKHSVIFLLVCSLPILDCRKSSGRGFSGARSQSAGGGGGGGAPHGGFGQPHGGGFNQPGPGYKPGGYPPQSGGGFPHQQPQPNFGGPQGGFGGNRGGPYGGGFQGPHAGAGFANTQNSNTARGKLLYGLGGALIGGAGTYLALSALHRDQTVSYNGREYGFDQQHFKPKSDEFTCSVPLEELTKSMTTTTTTVAPAAPVPDASSTTTTPAPANALNQAMFADGTRPRHVVWACKTGSEVCCEGTCCPAPAQNQLNGAYGNGGSSSGTGAGTVALIIFLVLLLLCCCICVVAYKSCRSAFEWMIPSNNAQNPNQTSFDDSYKYGNNQPYAQGYPYGNQPQQQQYPMQPYPQQPQQQYPTYPQQPPAYPAYPEPPKY